MRESFALSPLLAGQDFFRTQKRQSLEAAWQVCLDVLGRLEEVAGGQRAREDDFLLFLRCSLWGNKCDMSISGGEKV